MRPEAKLQRRGDGSSPGFSCPLASPASRVAPLHRWKGASTNHITHYQPQELIVRESGAGPPARIWRLVVLIDDASSRVYSGLFVEKDAIWSRFRAVHSTILTNGLFSRIHVDPALRDDHDCRDTGQFVRAMRDLEITVTPSCPTRARTRCTRVFRVLRESLPQQLSRAGIQSRGDANEFLRRYWTAFNRCFAVEPRQSKTSFEPMEPKYHAEVKEILCVHETVEIDSNNSVQYRGARLSIAESVASVIPCGEQATIHEYEDGTVSLFHGRQELGRYDGDGNLLKPPMENVSS